MYRPSSSVQSLPQSGYLCRYRAGLVSAKLAHPDHASIFGMPVATLPDAIPAASHSGFTYLSHFRIEMSAKRLAGTKKKQDQSAVASLLIRSWNLELFSSVNCQPFPVPLFFNWRKHSRFTCPVFLGHTSKLFQCNRSTAS